MDDGGKYTCGRLGEKRCCKWQVEIKSFVSPY
jgi:hypothetical protein